LPIEAKWCIYLKYHEDEGKAPLIEKLCREEEGIMSAEKVLNKVSREYEEWARALSRWKADMDYRSGMTTAHDRGHEQGLVQGLEQGYEKGLREREEQVQAAKAEAQAAKAQVRADGIRKLRELGVAEDIIAATFPDGGK
jgi:flagellar biosynthesis/type III secretory pathway protein FliH